MFCFQTPFTRASRVLVSPLSSNKGKTSSMSIILPMNKSSSSSKCDRRGSEATSEDSGSSIRYIDQEPSISTSSSIDTLPDIKTDYLDPESLSPRTDSSSKPSAIVSNGVLEENDLQEVLTENDQSSRLSSSIRTSPTKRLNGNRRCRKLLLRPWSNDSSSSSNQEACSGASASPLSDSIETESPSPSRNDENVYKVEESVILLTKSSPSVLIDHVDSDEVLQSCRATFENDTSSLQNTFSESEKENTYQETETEPEEGSSLPLSPAGPSSAGLSSTVPYYNFLCVNGGVMRQEMTSTSSPQLSSGNNLQSSAESTSPDVCSVEKNSRMDMLKPDGLESQCCLPAARSCPNLKIHDKLISSKLVSGKAIVHKPRSLAY